MDLLLSDKQSERYVKGDHTLEIEYNIPLSLPALDELQPAAEDYVETIFRYRPHYETAHTVVDVPLSSAKSIASPEFRKSIPLPPAFYRASAAFSVDRGVYTLQHGSISLASNLGYGWTELTVTRDDDDHLEFESQSAPLYKDVARVTPTSVPEDSALKVLHELLALSGDKSLYGTATTHDELFRALILRSEETDTQRHGTYAWRDRATNARHTLDMVSAIRLGAAVRSNRLGVDVSSSINSPEGKLERRLMYRHSDADGFRTRIAMTVFGMTAEQRADICSAYRRQTETVDAFSLELTRRCEQVADLQTEGVVIELTKFGQIS